MLPAASTLVEPPLLLVRCTTYASHTNGSRTLCSYSVTQLVHPGSPIRGLWKGVSAANTVWARHISAEALQPSDTYVPTAVTSHVCSVARQLRNCIQWTNDRSLHVRCSHISQSTCCCAQARYCGNGCQLLLLCRFAFRHNSASEEDVAEMVKATGFGSIDELIEATVPKAIKRKTVMDMGKYTNGYTESGFLSMFK